MSSALGAENQRFNSSISDQVQAKVPQVNLSSIPPYTLKIDSTLHEAPDALAVSGAFLLSANKTCS